MRNQTPVLLVLLVTALVWFAAQPTAANDIPFEWNNVPRVVAVGDVHGAYVNFISLLKNADAELVDDELRWISLDRRQETAFKDFLHVPKPHLLGRGQKAEANPAFLRAGMRS